MTPATHPAMCPSRDRAWPRFRRVQRQADLFGEMMERLNVSPRAAATEACGRAYAAAARRCLVCPQAAACRDWLCAGGTDAPPAFCPNAAYLERARRGTGA